MTDDWDEIRKWAEEQGKSKAEYDRNRMRKRYRENYAVR